MNQRASLARLHDEALDDAQALSPDVAREPSAAKIWYTNNERPILGLIGVVSLVAIWQIVSATGIANPLFVSSPKGVWQAGTEYMSSPEFSGDVRMSLLEFGVGLGGAILTGIPIGLLMGWYRRVEYLLDFIVNFSYAAPRVALMPLMILWFGIGIESKIALVYSLALFPVLINTMLGVKTVDKDLTRVAQSFNAKDRQIFRTIVLPSSVPSIISGVRLAIGLALIGVVVGEFVASTEGLGHRIREASTFFDTDKVFFGLLLIAGSGVVLTELLRRLERKFDRWRPAN